VISAGEKLDGKYVVDRHLGSGGFGDVYLATDEAIPSRNVAIKVLGGVEEGNHENLIWEMQALARMNHPGVVAFYHHFTDDDRLFLVMEYCDGGSLHDRIYSPGELDEEQVFEWGLRLCRTLDSVHAEGIVHHDIKPPNILFSDDGTIKIGDFGIANRNLGTRYYLPPEMLLGEAVSATDARVDVYALGLTLLEALTGHHPFVGLDQDEALQRRISHDFVPDDLPRWVQEVILKSTHPTPELRFQTAADLADAIRAKHVPYLFDSKRIKAHALAEKAETAIKRRKWQRAERLVTQALEVNPDCVAALITAGRCQLLLRRIDRASAFFTRAVTLNPRTQVQKELGWLYLEQDRLPQAISLLTDHLQRHASDYEAYNLLLKCFYLTERYEAGEELAQSVMDEAGTNECFVANQLLCRILSGAYTPPERETEADNGTGNAFVDYNLAVLTEEPRSWGSGGGPTLRSKLLFEEYGFGFAARSGRQNTLVITTQDGVRTEASWRVVTVGSLFSNNIVLEGRTVSRRHCAIVNCPDNVWMYDLGSTCGTTVGDVRVKGRVFLDGVHEVKMGKATIRVAAREDLLV
jgi:serine/threonine protein kinase